MSRAGPVPVRPLSLTEELEKLEQSITLTLQEIDHNFSRAHRIVTSSILPIVEQYADHSKAVWEGSKFWKQFFEASANVSLSGVEEREEEEEEEEDYSYAHSPENTKTYGASNSQPGDETVRTDGEDHNYDRVNDSILDSNDISGSTPRPPRPRSIEARAKFASYSSPYEALKREHKGKSTASEDDDEHDLELPPATPGTQQRIPDMSMTPASSPFDPTSYNFSAKDMNQDFLLHRVLDKNYRLQATPHKNTARKEKATRKENKTPLGKPSWRDDGSSPMSSPIAAPQLRSDIFGSPVRQQFNINAPRTPGVSVQTPARTKVRETASRDEIQDEITWDSDSDEDAEGVYRELGLSPPKTIQFSLPQSRLLQTPAREASKKIIEDLLATAGAGMDDTDELESPSIVQTRADLDDSF